MYSKLPSIQPTGFKDNMSLWPNVVLEESWRGLPNQLWIIGTINVMPNFMATWCHLIWVYKWYTVLIQLEIESIKLHFSLDDVWASSLQLLPSKSNGIRNPMLQQYDYLEESWVNYWWNNYHTSAGSHEYRKAYRRFVIYNDICLAMM